MVVVSSWEDWFPAEHLCEDTPDRPDVDRFCVLAKGEHNFRGAIIIIYLGDEYITCRTVGVNV